MIREEAKIIKFLFVIFDILTTCLSGILAYYIKWSQSEGTWSIENSIYIGSIVLISLLNFIIFKHLEVYEEKRLNSQNDLILNMIKGNVISFSILAGMIFIFQEKTYSRLFFGSFFLLSLIITIIQKTTIIWVINNYLKQNPYSKRILIIGNYERGKYIIDLMTNQISFGHKIIGFLPIETIKNDQGEGEAKIENIIRESCVDEIVFALNNDKNINVYQYINKCKKAGIVCRILPSLWNPGERSLDIEMLQGVPFIVLKSSAITEIGLMFKRAIDILFGSVGCIIFALTYPFIAVAIKKDSQGPILYKQKRVGKNGRIFQILKYRTMIHNAENFIDDIENKNEMKGPIFKINNDPRITRVGKWLRKTSLDELPQFWNVLKGEMSLVGTRPPTIEEVKKYKLEHLKRIAIKPGITGMWQVSGRNLIKDFETILELDFQYIENWSFKMELSILAKTIWVVLKGKGSY